MSGNCRLQTEEGMLQIAEVAPFAITNTSLQFAIRMLR
jgi:hypothetical protein